MNLPNKLTVARMIITPFFLLAMLLEFNYHYLVAAIIFIAASITDFLDGNIARKHNLVTTFGKLCDPVADKMLTTAALLALMRVDLCSIWIVMIVITREFAVTSFRLVASAQGVVIPADKWGKIKTVSQMVFIPAIILLAHFDSVFSFMPADGVFTLSNVSNALLWVTAVLTVVSGVNYIVNGKKIIDFSK